MKGHELYGEGFMCWDYDNGRMRVRGGCRCGAKPDGVADEADAWNQPPLPSKFAVRRWHHVHKAEQAAKDKGES